MAQSWLANRGKAPCRKYLMAIYLKQFTMRAVAVPTACMKAVRHVGPTNQNLLVKIFVREAWHCAACGYAAGANRFDLLPKAWHHLDPHRRRRPVFSAIINLSRHAMSCGMMGREPGKECKHFSCNRAWLRLMR